MTITIPIIDHIKGDEYIVIINQIGYNTGKTIDCKEEPIVINSLEPAIYDIRIVRKIDKNTYSNPLILTIDARKET